MIHKRYVVRWVVDGGHEDFDTSFRSEYTYLEREDAEEFANDVRHLAKKVQINEMIADFQVPAVVIPYEWLR